MKYTVTIAALSVSFALKSSMIPSGMKQLKLYRFSRYATRHLSSESNAKAPSLPVGDNWVITPRSQDYSAWYTDVITGADLVDHSPVRGCMIIKPWGMAVWDNIRNDLDIRIRESGADNVCFPLLIPMSFFSKEAQHVEGFAKECAVVTHYRLSQGEKGLAPDKDAELEEPLIIRPTSETIIWNSFTKWIQSHRDLPLKINQWANVVRWEMRTRPFLRTSEFLWQEGHTAHASSADAVKTSRDSLDMYAALCEEVLSIPCVKGEKSPSERFAGAESTLTIEAMMQNGWALQAGTSHFLGQNFAKAFDVYFQNVNQERELVWATSWGVSTRLIGAVIMTHSDDKGLVLPPKIAPQQVVIVPILGKQEAVNNDVLDVVHRLKQQLKAANIRVKVDDRDYIRPGSKYFEWERKGVPVRIDVGPKDVQKQIASLSTRIALRDSHEYVQKFIINTSTDDVAAQVQNYLQKIQVELLRAARQRLEENTHVVTSYDDMKRLLQDSLVSESAKSAGFFLAPWCCDSENEQSIKDDCKVTIRCYPFEQNSRPLEDHVKCFYSGRPATHIALFARAY